MLKKRTPKEKTDNTYRITAFKAMLVLITFTVTIGCVYLSNFYDQSYSDIAVGVVAPKRFTAPTQLVNRVATDKKIDEITSTVSTLYTHDDAQTQKSLEQLTVIIDFLEESRIQDLFNSSVLTGYVQGRMDDFIGTTTTEGGTKTTSIIPILLSEAQHAVYNLLTDDERSYFRLAAENVLTMVMQKGVTNNKEDLSYRYAQEELETLDFLEDTRALCYDIVVTCIEPNLFIDEAATEAARQVKAAEVDPVLVLRGQKIVDEGEIITEEIYSILKAANLITTETSSTLLDLLGIITLLAIAFAFLFTYIYTFERNLLATKKDMLLMVTLYLLALAIATAMSTLPYSSLPLMIVVMLFSILIDTRLAIAFNLVIALVAFFICGSQVGFLVYTLLTGTAAAMLTKLAYSRNKVLFVGATISVINAVIMLALALLLERSVSAGQWIHIGLAALSGFLSVIITTGSLPLWEAVFDVITPIKLMDLINPDNPLLKRLALETPGTYHHSLVVANLAETAAYDIGANPILARVGSYYHDIGKLKAPSYFSENQLGENPHDKLAPLTSTKIIVKHVLNGTEYSLQHNLPLAVRDMISQHHGTTLVKFFYYKAKKASPDTKVKESDYRYPGPIPQSREAALIMLADTIEAATRSVFAGGKKCEDLEGFVKTLIKDKLDDGQLNESKLAIKDLDTILQSFLKVFNGMYHDRIAYPTEEKEEPAAKEAVISVVEV